MFLSFEQSRTAFYAVEAVIDATEEYIASGEVEDDLHDELVKLNALRVHILASNPQLRIEVERDERSRQT